MNRDVKHLFAREVLMKSISSNEKYNKVFIRKEITVIYFLWNQDSVFIPSFAVGKHLLRLHLLLGYILIIY